MGTERMNTGVWTSRESNICWYVDKTKTKKRWLRAEKGVICFEGVCGEGEKQGRFLLAWGG